MGWNVAPPDKTSQEPLSSAWEANAGRWIEWARTPGHDSYWTFHRDAFRQLLPPPRGRTLDVGCGEGRLPRDLKQWGYDVVGVDVAPTMIEAARAADPGGDYGVANAADLPFADRSFDLVTAFMTLHDMDDFEGALGEMTRCVAPGGALCFAIVHPIGSAGAWEKNGEDRRFVIEQAYLAERRYDAEADRGGLTMTFSSYHRPLQSYTDALRANGFGVDRLIEVVDPRERDTPRAWIPLFLDVRAVRL